MIASRRNRRSLVTLVGVACLMGASAWASVPLYDWFCRVTGFGGTTLRAESVTADPVAGEVMRIRFDASRERGMPWEFRPLQRGIEVTVGQEALVYYEAYNPANYPVAGSATFNVFPFEAGEYFIKLECFCFQEQILDPGERVSMPVSFYVDPEILEDGLAGDFGEITLSYTFHEIEISDDLHGTSG